MYAFQQKKKQEYFITCIQIPKYVFIKDCTLEDLRNFGKYLVHDLGYFDK
jgi:hypothetical protein